MTPLAPKQLLIKSLINIEQSISHLSSLLQIQPSELIDSLVSSDLSSNDSDDIIYAVENIQEALNLTLDARKRLILLGCYSTRRKNIAKEEKNMVERHDEQVFSEEDWKQFNQTQQNHFTNIPHDPNTEKEHIEDIYPEHFLKQVQVGTGDEVQAPLDPDLPEDTDRDSGSISPDT